MNVIKIRAHHIESVKILFNLSREKLEELLIKEKYIKDKDDSFIDLVQQYIRLFNNPLQQFRLKRGGLDYLCKRCPKLKRKDCNPKKHEWITLGGSSYSNRKKDYGRDSEIIEEYKLDTSRIYTTAELKKILNFR